MGEPIELPPTLLPFGRQNPNWRAAYREYKEYVEASRLDHQWKMSLRPWTTCWEVTAKLEGSWGAMQTQPWDALQQPVEWDAQHACGDRSNLEGAIVIWLWYLGRKRPWCNAHVRVLTHYLWLEPMWKSFIDSFVFGCMVQRFKSACLGCIQKMSSAMMPSAMSIGGQRQASRCLAWGGVQKKAKNRLRNATWRCQTDMFGRSGREGVAQRRFAKLHADSQRNRLQT